MNTRNCNYCGADLRIGTHVWKFNIFAADGELKERGLTEPNYGSMIFAERWACEKCAAEIIPLARKIKDGA